MDLILDYSDHYALNAVYAKLFPAPVTGSKLALNATAAAASQAASWVPRDSIARQFASLFTISILGSLTLYFLFASLSYFFVYDRRLEHHPRFLPNQIKLEIQCTLEAVPWMAVLTVPFFVAEVRGYSKLYTDVSQYGWGYLVFSAVWFLTFTDFGIYWIHRIEHHPAIYKYIHKPHHKWIVPTPYAALAFHPVDGWAQSFPYHIFVFIFPMHRLLYLGLFVFVQFWTILIHDGDLITGHWLQSFINSPAHHTLHHIYFTCNYGQYFTWADKRFDSHREPVPELDPLIASLKAMKEKGLGEDGRPLAEKKRQ